MFIRIKMISGKPYAYLVSNKWTGRGARQKTNKYLGKVIKTEDYREKDFLKRIKGRGGKGKSIKSYVKKTGYSRIIDDLVLFEIEKSGFRRVKRGFKKKKIRFDYDKEFSKNIVLQINEGYLCNHTVKKLKSFRMTGDDYKDGFELAERFVHAGIQIPKELFVMVFEKKQKTNYSRDRETKEQ